MSAAEPVSAAVEVDHVVHRYGRVLALPDGLYAAGPRRNLYPTLSVSSRILDFYGRLFGQGEAERRGGHQTNC